MMPIVINKNIVIRIAVIVISVLAPLVVCAKHYKRKPKNILKPAGASSIFTTCSARKPGGIPKPARACAHRCSWVTLWSTPTCGLPRSCGGRSSRFNDVASFPGRAWVLQVVQNRRRSSRFKDVTPARAVRPFGTAASGDNPKEQPLSLTGRSMFGSALSTMSHTIASRHR